MTPPNQKLNTTLSNLPKEVEIKRASEQDLDALTFLLYGPPGSGKSWALGTAGSKTLIIDSGKGLATIKSLAFKEKYPDVDPLVVSLLESKVFRNGKIEGNSVKLLDATCDVIDQAIKNNSADFDTIGIDEMSAFSISVRYKAMEFNKIWKGMDTFKKAQDNKTIPMPEMNDFQTEQNTIAWFFRTYIPILVEEKKKLIVLAHARTEYQPAKKFGEEVKILRIMPAVAGKKEFAPEIFPSLFSDVWYTSVVGRAPNVEYRALTTGSETIVGKTRHGGIIANVEKDINFQEIFRRLENKIPLSVTQPKNRT